MLKGIEMSAPHPLLDRLFGKVEEINGNERCSTYLYRWVIASLAGRKIYLHKFVGNDWSRDLHDHPKRFISIGIWGSYLEETPKGKTRYRAPWMRTFPADHKHRLTTPWGVCWTIVIVLKTVREWGFWHEGRFIEWEEYVRGSSSHIADQIKDCP
jgi:hypothetical protein